MARQQEAGGSPLWNALDREFPYMALDTCAVDGLCATACPVNIDTGTLVKRFPVFVPLLEHMSGPVRIANNFSFAEKRAALGSTVWHAAERIIASAACTPLLAG